MIEQNRRPWLCYGLQSASVPTPQERRNADFVESGRARRCDRSSTTTSFWSWPCASSRRPSTRPRSAGSGAAPTGAAPRVEKLVPFEEHGAVFDADRRRRGALPGNSEGDRTAGPAVFNRGDAAGRLPGTSEGGRTRGNRPVAKGLFRRDSQERAPKAPTGPRQKDDAAGPTAASRAWSSRRPSRPS